MVIPSIEELNELEKHLYVQAFYCFGVGKAQEIYTELEKRNILNMLNEGSSESENTFCKSSILLAQMALLHKRNSSPYSLDEYRIKKPLQNNQLG